MKLFATAAAGTEGVLRDERRAWLVYTSQSPRD